MIGVIATEAEHPVVAEFFELFKTPWEFYRAGAKYDILICSHNTVPDNDAKLLLLFDAQECEFDQQQGISVSPAPGRNVVYFHDQRLPIYRGCLSFDGPGNKILVHERTNSAAAFLVASGTQVVVRLGFDLFAEVHYLLTQGQPAEFAEVPTLDLHISLLREVIVNQGVFLIEIPPAPAGHPFVVCLTHDVDHPRMRRHKFDHTMFGFLYRATVGSFAGLCRGRRSLRQLAINWKAAFSLPLVFAGLVKDFWDQLDRYLELEKDVSSTFFVIPTKGEPGLDSDGRTRVTRASAYGAADIADDIKKLLSAGREVAVHGIDAWRNSEKGRQERQGIRAITGATEIGIRMHWLYFGLEAPRLLERAGFSYDSTCGYNETIGYRAGTTQVFKYVGVDHMLELPLHIMDTALFYPSYMNLTNEEARVATEPLVKNATRFGGVLTVNWHDRSLGPERLWDRPYVHLLDDLRDRSPWFATASQAVSWFRKRRATSFVRVQRDGQSVRVRPARNPDSSNLPLLTVRTYNIDACKHHFRVSGNVAVQDFTLDHAEEVLIAA